jgi:hypothetical protein
VRATACVPDLEVDRSKSLDAVDGVVLEDEALVGLDETSSLHKTN